MTSRIIWDSANLPIGLTLDQLLYRVRSADQDCLMLDPLTLADIMEDSDGVLAVFDALVTPYARLKRKIEQLGMVMDKSVPGVTTVSVQISEPFKQNGNVQVAVVYELSDGQTATVMFHNPDSTPTKLSSNDEMISWKWMLNKKDITIVVAPENGHDLAVREVGRRIMKLALKNSAAFARVNQKRAERLENIKTLEGECIDLDKHLDGLNEQIKAAQDALDQKLNEDAKIPKSKKFYDFLVGKEWSQRLDDLLFRMVESFGGEVKIFADFDDFKNDLITINTSAVLQGKPNPSEQLTLTGDIGVDYEEFEKVVEVMATGIRADATLGALADLLRDTYKFQVKPLTALEIEVISPRTDDVVDIELDDDGTFLFDSVGLAVKHLDGEANISEIAKKLDEIDFVASLTDFPDDPELDDGLVQGGVFKGKSFEFAYAVEQIEIAVNTLPDLNLAFGDFNYTAQSGGLFDSVVSESNPPIVGITAQIGYKPTDVILARVELDDKGNAIIYRGEGGTSKERELSAPSNYSYFKQVFEGLIAELNVEPSLEDTLPELKAYLDQFTPLKRGQIFKSLSRTAYDDDGVKVTVAQNVISFANRDGAQVITNTTGKTLSDGKYNLSTKLGKIPLNFGVWLLESGTVKPKEVTEPDPEETTFTIKQVADAMAQTGMHSVWWEDPGIVQALTYAEQQKWVFRPSVSQIEWTELGIKTLKEHSDKEIKDYQNLIADYENKLPPKTQDPEPKPTDTLSVEDLKKLQLEAEKLIENIRFLESVIANPENHVNDQDLSKLESIVEALGDDNSSDLAQKADQASTLIQEVVFKQLQAMVGQG